MPPPNNHSACYTCRFLGGFCSPLDTFRLLCSAAADPSYRSVTSRHPLLLGTIIIPESPRFLAEKGLLSSAEDALSLRALPREHPDILEVEELREDAQALEMLDTPERSFFRELLDKC